MNAEERLQKITERMRDLGPTLPAAGELYRQIMELLPPPPGLIRPEDADVNTVYRVEVDELEYAGWRCDPEATGPWLLNTGIWVEDESVTIIGRADLPQGAPLVLTTVEDYERAPEDTIVLLDKIGEAPWQKASDGKWMSMGGTWRWFSGELVEDEPRRVIRWGRGE